MADNTKEGSDSLLIQQIYAQLGKEAPSALEHPLPLPTLRARIERILTLLGKESEEGAAVRTEASTALLLQLCALLKVLGSTAVPKSLFDATRELSQLIGDAPDLGSPASGNVSKRLQELLSMLGGASKLVSINGLLDGLENTVGQPGTQDAAQTVRTSIQDQLDQVRTASTQLGHDLKVWQEGVTAQLAGIESRLATLRNSSPEKAGGKPGQMTTAGPWLYILGTMNFLILVVCLATLIQMRLGRPESGLAPHGAVDGGTPLSDAGKTSATTEPAGRPVFQQCSPELKCPESRCSCPAPILGPIYVQPGPVGQLNEQRRESIPDAGTRGRSTSKP